MFAFLLSTRAFGSIGHSDALLLSAFLILYMCCIKIGCNAVLQYSDGIFRICQGK